MGLSLGVSKPKCQVPSKPAMFSIDHDMDDPMRIHRKERLREYLERYAPGASLADRRSYLLRKVSKSKGWLSQLENGGFGEAAGRKLAVGLGIGDDRWFEKPFGTLPARMTPKVGVPSGLEQGYPIGSVLPVNTARSVPVIGRSMTELADRIWDSTGRPIGVAEEFAYIATADAQAFLIRVEGDSMAPKYEDGQ